MSIIVAVNKNDHIVMATDTLTCYGDSHRLPAANSRTSKARRIGAAIVGSAGWAVYDRILDDYLRDRPAPNLGSEAAIYSFFLELWKALRERYTLVNDQAQSKDSPFGDLDSSFLIASQGGIFKVSPDLDVGRFQQYYAIGSGADYALGAMHTSYATHDSAEEVARVGVAAACAFDVYCDGQLDLIKIE